MVRLLENSILLFQGENRLIFILIVLVCVFKRKFLRLFNENNFYYVKYAFLGRSFYNSLICYF